MVQSGDEQDAGRAARAATVSWAVAGVLLYGAVVLGLLRFVRVRFASSPAAVPDGLPAGVRAPSWSLPDSAGVLHTSPPAAPLQLIVFADHLLGSFPSVADGLRELAAGGTPAEILLLLPQPSPKAEPTLARLGLHGVFVVLGSPELYAAYRVRTGPFLSFVDSAGLVRASGLVNYAWQVARLRQLAEHPAAVLPPARTRRSLRG